MSDKQSLLLLRHAEADPWYPGVSDLERRLSEQGLAHMAKLSAWAAAHVEPPELVLCSTATRTRQTLESLGPGWVSEQTGIRMDPDMYEATTGYLHSLVDSAFSSVARVLLVGHNPGLGYLSRAVIAEPPASPGGVMTPGSLAVIEFDQGWLRDAGQGRVLHWVNPGQFE
jgi:phosphohistidine phosphatase